MIHLENVYDQNGNPRMSAIQFLYTLLAERPHAANISHAAMPTMLQHKAFVESCPYRAWYLVTDPLGLPIGAVYATRSNELGVAILRAHQRRGYAREALHEFMERHDPLPAAPAIRRGSWVANVSPKNDASQALFGGALGGKIISVTYEL